MIEWFEMKITIEINDIDELIKLRDWLNTMPIDKQEFDLNQSIDILELSIRSNNCLRSAYIETVGDLIKWSSKGLLLNIENLGKKSIYEIEEALSRYNLKLSSGDYLV